ncbi:MAG: hypothetical protein GX879_00450 [Bacteroidales bacterium]|nr:hypothetical protein [Bacteroidales bacterium]
MKKLSIVASIIAIVAISFSACQPYEEGPSFSLLSKKTRLAGTWEVTDWTANGTSIEDVLSTKPEYQFFKDGTGSLSLVVPLLNIRVSEELEWQFLNNGEQIKLRIKKQENWDPWNTYNIVKLYNTEMVVEHTSKENDIDVTYRLSLKKK